MMPSSIVVNSENNEDQSSKTGKIVEEEWNVSDTALSSESTLYENSGFSERYLEKSKLLSRAIDEIGFGKYQVGLFFVAGFGWLSDNAWPIVTSLILPRLTEVDGVHSPAGKGPYLTFSSELGIVSRGFGLVFVIRYNWKKMGI